MSLKNLTLIRVLFILAAIGGSQIACATAQVSHGETIELFAGSDLAAFNQVGNGNWKVESGEIVATTGNGFLVTKESFSDFHLKLEFFSDIGTNSGVFVRCALISQIDDQKCYEANIFDTRPDQTYRTGAIAGYASPKAILNTEDGRWHTYEVRALGDRLQVFLDGKETVFLRDTTHSAGTIALQIAKGGIKFRNVRLTKMDSRSSLESSIDGVWELKSFNLIDPSGKTTPWCEGSYGVIIYTEGYMSVAINCLSDSKKVLHYSGPFQLEGNMVVHSVRNYSDSSLNQVFRREVKLPDAERLELSGPLSNGGKAVISWERR